MPFSRRAAVQTLAASAGLLLSSGRLAAQPAPRLLICGDDTVYEASLAGDPSQPRWEDVRSWRASESASLPAPYAERAFATTDDCKPIDEGTRVLVTSSSGGVAIYDRSSLQTLFYAIVRRSITCKHRREKQKT